MTASIRDVQSRESGCAECGRSDMDWASLSLGIFLCAECAGVHRSLGTSVSRVKSVSLDSWTPSEIAFMESRSHSTSLAEWEAVIPSSCASRRPSVDSDIPVKRWWIVAKYSERLFRVDGPFGTSAANIERRPSSTIPSQLWAASRLAVLVVMGGVQLPDEDKRVAKFIDGVSKMFLKSIETQGSGTTTASSGVGGGSGSIPVGRGLVVKVWRPALWRTAFNKTVHDVRFVDSKIEVSDIRRLMMDLSMGLFWYKSVKENYDDTHRSLAFTLRELALEAGSDCPLCVISFGVGVYPLLTHLREVQEATVAIDVQNMLGPSWLARGDTLAALHMIGCPLPMLGMSRGDLPQAGALSSPWTLENHFYDDDPLGCAVSSWFGSPNNDSEETLVKVFDRVRSNPSVFFSDPPHLRYFGDAKLQQAIASSLAASLLTMRRPVPMIFPPIVARRDERSGDNTSSEVRTRGRSNADAISTIEIF